MLQARSGWSDNDFFFKFTQHIFSAYQDATFSIVSYKLQKKSNHFYPHLFKSTRNVIVLSKIGFKVTGSLVVKQVKTES